MNTAEQRRERLRQLKDEVKDLHPVLKLLLPKMVSVQEVEYTHGATEMGADFVLARINPDFGHVEYVGVIAKAENIGQDHNDVKRQIEECEVERFFNNGKKKVFVSEVWVVTTGIVTHNAQTKIHHEYKSRKINFIDGDRLCTLIDKYLPNFWTDVALNVGDYLHTIRLANEQNDRRLSMLPPQSERFYIDQDLVEADDFNPKRSKSSRPVNIHTVLKNHQVVLIEGGMGAGKSKLLRNLIDFYSQPEEYLRENLLPVNVSFKDFVDKFNSDPRKAISTLVPVEVQDAKGQDDRYLILMDGADEKDLSPDELAKAVETAATAIVAAGMKTVITSRWCEAFEGNSSLGRVAKRLDLRPLSTDRLIEFISRLCRKFDIKSRLLEDLKKSALFKELPRTPIAAILLAQLLNENSDELPSNLTELYSKFTELALGRWDIEKGLQTQKEFEAIAVIVGNLAVPAEVPPQPAWSTAA